MMIGVKLGHSTQALVSFLVRVALRKEQHPSYTLTQHVIMVCRSLVYRGVPIALEYCPMICGRDDQRQSQCCCDSSGYCSCKKRGHAVFGYPSCSSASWVLRLSCSSLHVSTSCRRIIVDETLCCFRHWLSRKSRRIGYDTCFW